jgi:CHAT domain-containing protein/Tfp pilus assembly protein PilF
MEHYQQALAIEREIGDRSGEASTLNNMALDYSEQGEYAQALELLQQALKIAQTIGDKAGEAGYLSGIGITYTRLGQYPQALEYRQKALAIAREIGSRPQEAIILGFIGVIYRQQERYPEAIEQYRQSLALAREIGDRATEGRMLSNLGYVYERQGKEALALESFQQALAIFRDNGDLYWEGFTLGGLGLVYDASGRDAQALESYQQAIAIQQEIGDKAGESQTLSDLSVLLAKQNQPELAIVFFKQSVNVREGIRGNISGLSEELQQSYTQSIADTYRQLAELLLQQDRVLEAQEVLDLLKLQELEDYLRNVRGNIQTVQKLDFWQAEQQILNLYDQSIGQNPNTQFKAFVNSPGVTALVTQLRRTARGQNLNPEQLTQLQDNLQALDKAALLYPLILEDRVELVLVTPSSLVRKTVAVERVKLNKAITNFRSDIANPSSNPLPNAQQLYQWLIQPLENDLEQAQVQTILYAADKQLRYIPLAALHDGKQWLIQRFTLNHITAASLTNFNRNNSRPLQILAAAFSDSQLNHQFQIGEKQFNFNGLKYAGVEVNTIAKEIPGTTAFFQQRLQP